MIEQYLMTIDATLLGTTTQCQSGPGSNGNERVLHILQSSRTLSPVRNYHCIWQVARLKANVHLRDKDRERQKKRKRQKNREGNRESNWPIFVT